MKSLVLRLSAITLFVGLATVAAAQLPGNVTPEAYDKEMKSLLEQATLAKLTGTPQPIVPLTPDWQLGMISWAAMDREGVLYLLQRGKAADPVVVVDRSGRVVRSWGSGRYSMPHSIRIDPQGNVWTTDARTSTVTKFAPDGKVLLEIAVGGVPEGCGTPSAPNPFCGTTDVAFGKDGHVFVADGYRNARVLEFAADGAKIREWSTATPGTAMFARAHSIAVGDDGVVYVADRENARIQRFSAEGKLLGEWGRLGRPFALAMASDGLWVASLPVVEPYNLGNLIKVDLQTGKPLERASLPGVHGLYAGRDAVVITPGVEGRPLVFRRNP